MRRIDADLVMFAADREFSEEDAAKVRWLISHIPTAEKEPVAGETSDGYHTFNELYHHRAVLFSVIVKAFPEKAWKSKRHNDGSVFDGMFIVGIETPNGQATYHYDIDPYWDMFKCNELECAPEWDGHTAADAIERIGKLKPEPVAHGMWNIIDDGRSNKLLECSNCHYTYRRLHPKRSCPNCCAKMDLEVQDE